MSASRPETSRAEPGARGIYVHPGNLHPVIAAFFLIIFLYGISAARADQRGFAGAPASPPAFGSNATVTVAAATAQSPDLSGRSLTGGRSAAPPTRETGTLTALWRNIQQQQAKLHRDLAGAVKRLKTDNVVVAAMGLIALSFAYGVIHALGPGHGKMIITTYAVANERTARRGALVALLAGVFQALSAILLVSIMSLALKRAGVEMRSAAGWLESASYALIALFGVWLFWLTLRRVFRRRRQEREAVATSAHTHAHALAHDTPGADLPHRHGADHVHDASCGCGHTHIAAPALVEKNWSVGHALAMALTVGIRPCTGAIIVLVFAIAQGLYWAGVLATIAMSLGTALTVATLTVLAVGGRDLAARLTGGASPRAAVLTVDVLGFSGALVLTALGATLFAASLNAPSPF